MNPTRRHVCALSRKEVAQAMKCSPITVARLERSALNKLRAHPDARLLLRYICQQNDQSSEHPILRKFGAVQDASFLALSGFAPNS